MEGSDIHPAFQDPEAPPEAKAATSLPIPHQAGDSVWSLLEPD